MFHFQNTQLKANKASKAPPKSFYGTVHVHHWQFFYHIILQNSFPTQNQIKWGLNVFPAFPVFLPSCQHPAHSPSSVGKHLATQLASMRKNSKNEFDEKFDFTENSLSPERKENIWYYTSWWNGMGTVEWSVFNGIARKASIMYLPALFMRARFGVRLCVTDSWKISPSLPPRPASAIQWAINSNFNARNGEVS